MVSRIKPCRGQAGLDLIASYGWIVVVGVGAALLLSQTGVFRPTQCAKSMMGFSQAVPVDWAVYRDGRVFVLKVENWAGDDIEVLNTSVFLGDVMCKISPKTLVQPGNNAFITLNCQEGLGEYQVGTCYTAEVEITYMNRVSGNYDISRGKLRGVIEQGAIPTTTIDNPPTLVLNGWSYV